MNEESIQELIEQIKENGADDKDIDIEHNETIGSPRDNVDGNAAENNNNTEYLEDHGSDDEPVGGIEDDSALINSDIGIYIEY